MDFFDHIASTDLLNVSGSLSDIVDEISDELARHQNPVKRQDVHRHVVHALEQEYESISERIRSGQCLPGDVRARDHVAGLLADS